MKTFFKKLGLALSNFFKSLGHDFVEIVKHHWLKVTGYIIMLIVPLVWLIAEYITKTPSKWTIPVFVWIPIAVLIIVYWCKVKSYLAVKVSSMQVENNIDKGKHAGAIILITFIQLAMTVAPFVLGYFVFDMLEKASISVKNIFLILSYLEGAGAVLILLDTIYNVSNLEINAENNEENKKDE